MYSIQNDFHIPGPNAKSGKDRSVEFARFMALSRAWVAQGGSMLDIEETLQHLGLATDAAGWQGMEAMEVETALGVAQVYNSMARAAFKGTIVKECNQIAPWMAGGAPLDISDVPLQVAFTVGGSLNAEMVTDLVFTAAPGAYSALTALSADDIVARNAAVRAAGLLGDGQDAIEIGKKRVVIRKEFFENVLAASLKSSATRNSIPWLAGMTLKLQSNNVAAGTIVGDPPRRGDVYRNGSSVIVVAGFDGTEVAALSVTSHSAGVHTHVDGVRQFTTTGAFSRTDYATAEVVRNADIADGTNGPTVDSQYPTIHGTTGAFQTSLYPWAQPVRVAAMGGDALTGVASVQFSSRDDTRGRLWRGLKLLAGALELYARDDIDLTIASAQAVRDALRDASLYRDALGAMGVGKYADFSYASGNGNAVVLGQLATLTVGAKVARGMVVAHTGDGTNGTISFAILEDGANAFPDGTAGATATFAVATHSSTATLTSSFRAIPPHIGDPASGADQFQTSPAAELEDSFAELSVARLMMHGVSGGAITLAANTELRPSGLQHNENMRHVFVSTALAWLDKIAVDNTADAANFPNTKATLANLGWPSWVSGSVQATADGLNLTDQTLWKKYLTDLAVVASGHRIEGKFLTDTSIQPPALGIAPIVTPGRLTMTPELAVAGEHDASFFVTFGVPKGLATVLESGRILVELPAGLIFTSADFPATPNTTGTASISSDGRRLDIVFDDDGGSGYAAGAIVNIVRCSVRAVQQVGDVAHGELASIRPLAGWTRDGDATELAGLIAPGVLSVVTELR